MEKGWLRKRRMGEGELEKDGGGRVREGWGGES